MMSSWCHFVMMSLFKYWYPLDFYCSSFSFILSIERSLMFCLGIITLQWTSMSNCGYLTWIYWRHIVSCPFLKFSFIHFFVVSFKYIPMVISSFSARAAMAVSPTKEFSILVWSASCYSIAFIQLHLLLLLLEYCAKFD